MKVSTDKRRLLWLGAVLGAVVAIVFAFSMIPAGPAPDPGPAGVDVPNMENVPPEQAPNMQLELEKKDQQ